jgi:hypothetical protein
MQTLKLGLLSFFVGLAMSILPIAVYSACDATFSYRDAGNCHIVHTCTLAGPEECSDHVCVCAYTCDGECGHWEEGPCPETGPTS